MWKEFRIAISFLTRLPLKYTGEWDERAFSRAAIFYPLVGLIAGLIVAVFMWLFSFVNAELAAVAGLLTAVIVSGGLHLDGFMDTCDGVFAARGRERALEIMKDSHSGSFAVIGVVLLLLFKFVLYTALVESGAFISAVLCGAIFGRLFMLVGLVCFPSARETGLGVTVQRYVPRQSVVWGVVLLLIVLLFSFGWQWLPALVLAALAMTGIACLFNRFLGGLTGDVYGALCELGDVVFLLFAVLAATVAPHWFAPPLF